MSAAYPLHTTNSSKTKSAAFGTTSVVFAALTIILPIVVMVYIGVKASEVSERDKPLIQLLLVFVGGAAALVVSGVTSVLGTLAGGIALARHERKSWLAAIGLIVNVPIALFAIYVFLMAQMNGG